MGWLIGSIWTLVLEVQGETSLRDQGSQRMKYCSGREGGVKIIGDYNLQDRKEKYGNFTQKCYRHMGM